MFSLRSKGGELKIVIFPADCVRKKEYCIGVEKGLNNWHSRQAAAGSV
jgi:hypothetical protein